MRQNKDTIGISNQAIAILIHYDYLGNIREVEKQTVFDALERNNWKRMATCRELGISKDTLGRKIHRFNLTSQRKQKITELSAPLFRSAFRQRAT